MEAGQVAAPKITLKQCGRKRPLTPAGAKAPDLVTKSLASRPPGPARRAPFAVKNEKYGRQSGKKYMVQVISKPSSHRQDAAKSY
jgi:hypothetical protein